MGMDICFGTCFGVKIYEDLVDELGAVKTTVIRYNSISGEKYEQASHKYMVRLKVPLGEWDIGDEIDDDELMAYLRGLSKELSFCSDGDWGVGELNFIVTYRYIGITSFKGTEPYVSPQDTAFDLVLNRDAAEKKWNGLFPDIQGRNMCYIRVSV